MHALPQDMDEVELVQHFQAGDVNALSTLYRRHQDRLYRRTLRVLPVPDQVESIVQDTFVKAWNKRDTLTDARRFFAWLASIARNEAMMWHRKQSTRRDHHDNVVDLEMDRLQTWVTRGPEAVQEQRELAELVEECFETLNPRYATALRLKFIEGKSAAECAAALEVKPGTFHVLLHRALKAFRAKYPPR